jgi:hypothetical protein
MDMQSIFRNADYIYYVKLINGDSLIGKSDDSEDVINEHGAVVLFDVMKTVMRIVAHDNGQISEIMTLSPWLDACELSTPVSLAIESIVAIAAAKADVARKYSAYVLAQSIKEASRGDEERHAAERAVAAANAAAKQQHESSELEEDYAEPRKPELLSRERMMEAEMDGDIEDIPEEVHEEKQPHYRVGNVTYH